MSVIAHNVCVDGNGSLRRKETEVRYDEHSDMGVGWNRGVPDCVWGGRLLLPVQAKGNLSFGDLNMEARQHCRAFLHDAGYERSLMI